MLSAEASVRHQVAERERTGQGTATAERLLKAGWDGHELTPTNVQRILAAPLDRLWKERRITAREHDAGETFRSIAYLAAIDPGTMSVNWDMAGGAGWSPKVPVMFSSQKIADARIEWRRLEGAITGMTWTVLRLGLIRELSLVEIGRSVFGEGNDRDARVAGEAGLRLALNVVADAIGR